MRTDVRLRFVRILAVVAVATASMAWAEEPLARFGVISDIHLLPSDSHRSDVLRDAFKYMDARKADGVVACGDLTQNGTVAELRAFGDIWRAVFPGNRRSDGEHVEKLFVYGDHDTEPTFLPGVFAHHKKHGVYPDWTPTGC